MCQKFLHRHRIKSVFERGLEDVAKGFVAEMERRPCRKVFHDRLQTSVFLKTIDIVDLPIE